ncbi:MAG: aminopeptidase P family N-terminal domain-containing protein, partial [Clostridia bacterium]|nr:aminopeptidase P family N-terminal domain-containing protein [Clostridia bacterium]
MDKTLRYITENAAVLITTPINRRYLTGFSSSLGYLLMTKQGNTLFVDGRYFEAAKRYALGTEVVLLKNIFEQINEILEKYGV